MNQLGTTLLYLSHLFHSIQLSLSNRTAKDQLRFIHWTSYAPNLIHKSSSNRTSDWLYREFSCLCGQNSQKRNDLTSILVVDCFLKLDSLKWSSTKLLFFISIKKSYYILKFMALLYFVQMSMWSRSPQLTPCNERTQITLKSKQEFSDLVNYLFSVYFPLLSSKDDICFRRKLGLTHVKFDHLNQQLNLIVWVDLNRYYVWLLYITLAFVWAF